MTVDLSSARATINSCRALRDHPATSTRFFRWWLALPILVALAYAYRDVLHEAFHFAFRMAEPPAALGPGVEGPIERAPAFDFDETMERANAVLDLVVKAGTTLGAFSWLWLRGKGGGAQR